MLFISLLQLRTIFVCSIDAVTENGGNGCCKPDRAPQSSHILNVHQLLLREKEKDKTWTPGSRGDMAVSCMPGVWCMLFLRQQPPCSKIFSSLHLLPISLILVCRVVRRNIFGQRLILPCIVKFGTKVMFTELRILNYSCSRDALER